MKKNLLLFGIFTILFLSMVKAQTIEAPQINITLMNQDPDPVGPGEYVEIRFKIYNNYAGTEAKNFQLELDPIYPFSLDPNEKALRDIGTLPALGDGGNVIVVKYKVRVDDNAVEGSNPIKLKYKHDNIDWITREFNINVQTIDANLAIISVATDPSKIKPGDKAIVKIKVKNMADSTMKDITMKLDLTFSSFLDQVATLTATDSLTAFNSLPFAPMESATEQKIYKLEPGEEHIFNYDLIAYSDAESRVYKVPVIITYYDELETVYTKNDIIGLIVGTKPDMSVVIDESDLYVGKQSGVVTIRFINKGFSDVKFLDVEVGDTSDFELLSSPEVYIGNVDSDDYETADFNIYLNNGAIKKEKSITFPVHVEYRDANNNIYMEEHNLELKILKPEKLGIKRSSGMSTFLIIIVIVGVGGYFYYRRKKRRK